MASTNLFRLQLEASTGKGALESWLSDYLVAYLSEGSRISAEDAAEMIHSLLPNPDDAAGQMSEIPRRFFSKFWDLMFRLAVQLDYEDPPMERFMSLVRALRDMPSNIMYDDDVCVWKGLPQMLISLDECCNRTSWEGNAESLRRWKNLHGLLAYMTNEGLNFGVYNALESIELAFERGDSTSLAFVSTASMWFTHCGRTIYKACFEEYMNEGPVHPRPNDLWKGESGYSLRRWEFWRFRLFVTMTLPDSDETIEEACLAALNAMDAAAGQGCY